MTLFISLKERFANPPDVFRQIELWANGLESYLRLSGSGGGGGYNDVPLGQAVVRATGPPSPTSYTTLATVYTATFNAVAGHVYHVSCYALGTQQTAAGWAIVFVGSNDAAATLNNGGVCRAVDATLASGVETASSFSGFYAPTTTRSTTFSVTCQTSAGSFSLGTNASSLVITRIL